MPYGQSLVHTQFVHHCHMQVYVFDQQHNDNLVSSQRSRLVKSQPHSQFSKDKGKVRLRHNYRFIFYMCIKKQKWLCFTCADLQMINLCLRNQSLVCWRGRSCLSGDTVLMSPSNLKGIRPVWIYRGVWLFYSSLMSFGHPFNQSERAGWSCGNQWHFDLALYYLNKPPTCLFYSTCNMFQVQHLSCTWNSTVPRPFQGQEIIVAKPSKTKYKKHAAVTENTSLHISSKMRYYIFFT